MGIPASVSEVRESIFVGQPASSEILSSAQAVENGGIMLWSIARAALVLPRHLICIILSIVIGLAKALSVILCG